MKNILKLILLLLFVTTVTTSCSKNDDLAVPSELQVNDFVWKGLNQFYLVECF